MRVLIWGANPLARDSAYWFWLKTGMEAVGHQVIALDVLPLAGLYGLTGMQQILLQVAKAYRVQAAIVVPQAFVEPWCLEALKASGVALVGFGYDDGMLAAFGGAALPRATAQMQAEAALCCHLAVTVSRTIGGILAGHGLPEPYYLPMPYGWQAVPAAELPLRPVVAFCGSPKNRTETVVSWRVRVMRALRQAGVPLELHHDGWKEIPGLSDAARPTPTLDGFFRVFRSSMVNLCLAAEGTAQPYRGMKLLSLEIAAAGGPQLVTPSAELADIFTAGEDLLTAWTVDEVVDQARALLAQPERARRMGQKSRQSLLRTCGWEIWWEQVAARLAAQGVTLDLAAPAVIPDAADTAWLATVMTAVAHAYEKQGDGHLADVYYGMVLAWRPDDYAANAGRARLAASPEAALPYWRRAALETGPTLPVLLPCPLGMPGVTARNSTNYRFDAADNWMGAALAAGRFDDLFEALALFVPHTEAVAGVVADRLLACGQVALAQRAVAMGLAHWPDQAALRERQGRLGRPSGAT
jgi:hypothetical protein